MTIKKCLKCGFVDFEAEACKRCGENMYSLSEAAQHRQRTEARVAPLPPQPSSGSMLCTSCGSTVSPTVIWRGSAAAEVVLFFGGLLMLCVLPLLGVGMIVAFLIYAVWRMTAKYQGCPACRGSNIIPVGSPVARQFLAGR